MTVRLPGWISPITTAQALNRQATVSQTQRNVAGPLDPVGPVYGQKSVGGQLHALDYDETSGTYTALYTVGVGEIEAIDEVYLAGALPKVGVSLNLYTGTTSQGVDPLLAAAIPGYADTLVETDEHGTFGYPYVAASWTDEEYPGWPDLVARVRGRKVWNPNTQTRLYSTDPAQALADVLSDPHIGLGEPVDDDSLAAMMAINAADVGGAPRRAAFGLALQSVRETQEWIDVLAEYAGCWPVKRAGVWYLVPDRPRPIDRSYQASVSLGRKMKLHPPRQRNVPTIVRVIYTSTASAIWQERDAFYPDPDSLPAGTPRRVAPVRLTGIRSYAEAYRAAQRRYNLLRRTQLEFLGGPETMVHEPGDVISIAHPMLDAIAELSGSWRITSIVEARPDQFAIRGYEYDDADYTDAAPADPNLDGANYAGPDAGTGLGGGGGGDPLTIFRQATPPTANATNDLWFETDTQILYQWDGSAWVILANAFDDTSDLTDGAGLGLAAVWAQITGSGKPADNATRNTIYRQASQPSGQEGDLWYETDTGLWYQYTGSAWQVAANSFDATSDLTDDAGLGDTANWSQIVDDDTNKPADNATQNTVYRQATAPSSPVNGDLWFETDTDTWWIREGGAWHEAATIGAVAGDNLVVNYSRGDVKIVESTAETSAIGATYTKVKEFQLSGDGVVDVEYDIQNSDPASPGSVSDIQARQGGVTLKTQSTGAPGQNVWFNGISFTGGVTLDNAVDPLEIWVRHTTTPYTVKLRNVNVQVGSIAGETVIT